MQLRAIAANPVPEFSPVITGSRQLARVRKRTVSPSVWIVLVAQVPQKPERQRDAHARHSRYATDADQQEIVVHNNYQDACPSA